MTIAAPAVHLNGTSREALSDGFEAGWNALNDAMRVLQRAAPNARDYYVQPGDAYKLAAEQHMARLRKIQDVMDELEFLVGAVAKP